MEFWHAGCTPASIAVSFRLLGRIASSLIIAGIGCLVVPLHCLKNWWPTCLQAAVLQFTTASRERVGHLHVCKLRGFSSLWHHAKERKCWRTYMFASCSASVHYGLTRKGWPPTCFARCGASVHYGLMRKSRKCWRPTCLQAAVLQFTTASRERVGHLHVCKLGASVHYGIMRKSRKCWRPTCLQAAVLQFTTASRERVGDLHVCKLQGWFSSLRHHTKGLATYMFASSRASLHEGINRYSSGVTSMFARGFLSTL